jgi:hypothetical protein
MKKLAKKNITAQEFDKKFDAGEDLTEFLETKSVKVNRRIQRVNIDFPVAFLKELDEKAEKIGVARTALIKMWLADYLKQYN